LDRWRLIIAQQVHLREDDAMRFLRELQRIRLDLGAELIVFRLPIDCVDWDEERQDARSLDVTEELKAQPTSFVRALDDAREIGDDERAVVAQLNDAEIGAQRSEGIVADLRAGGGDYREQRRFARVRLSHESDVGDELELELERARLAVFPRLIF